MKKLSFLFSAFLLFAMLLAGCAQGEPSAPGEFVTESHVQGETGLEDVVELNPERWASVFLYWGEDAFLDLTDTAGLTEVSSFLSAIRAENQPRELPFANVDCSVAWADYQVTITYVDGSKSYLAFFPSAGEVWMSGQTKQGARDDRYVIYPLSAFSGEDMRLFLDSLMQSEALESAL